MKPGERVSTACAKCGVEVVRYVSQIARFPDRRVFCGVACQGRSASRPRTGQDKQCKQCGQQFYAAPANAGRKQAQFCCVACFNRFQSVLQVDCACMVCSKPFAISASDLELRGGDTSKLCCSRACDRIRRTKNGIGRYHNGREVIRWSTGYLFVWEPDHPYAVRNGWVAEHRWVMEQQTGRILVSAEHVHHINGKKDDNRLENLVIMSHSEHSTLSNNERQADIQAMRDELEEYRRRFGALN